MSAFGTVAIHTSGAWVARRKNDDDEWEVHAPENPIGPTCVALVYGGLGMESEANARLIEAAPDLLVALQEARACIFATCRARDPKANGGTGLATPEEQVAVEMIRLALNKAGGAS